MSQEQHIPPAGSRRAFLRTAALGIAAFFVYATRQQTTVDISSGPREGLRAPAIVLGTLGGAEMSLADVNGRVVIVNFWASWCAPCRAEMPALQRLYDAEHAGGLDILAVNSTVQDDPAAIAGFATEFGLTFPILLDTTGDAGRHYRVQALPSTFIIDRRGVVRRVLYGGPLSEAMLRAAVEPLLWERA